MRLTYLLRGRSMLEEVSAGVSHRGWGAMKAYLVTGGAGFIGSHIVDRLVELGENVRVLDDFSTGKVENIEHNLAKIQLTRGSVADLETVRRAMDGVRIVLHQAAIPSVQRSVEDPIGCNEVNLAGTLNILAAAKDAGVERVVYASSSSVYGDSPALPKVEDMPADPLTPYALTKLAGEHYCRIFTGIYGLETVALRYFNVFGPRQDPASEYAAVVPKFVTLMLQDQPPVTYGDGLQSRDFIYVDDVVSANVLASQQPNVGGEVLNVAGGRSFSLLDLVDAINRVLGKSIRAVAEPARPGDVRHSLADIRKARDVLGFSPEVGFEDGLEKLTAWLAGGRA